jgi:hypothetical protein
MSTYGKKAMVYWEYEEKNTQEELYRFNHTTHNIQEEIIKRWYPIGLTCQQYSKNKKEYYGSFTITKCVKMAYGWRIEVIDKNGYINTLHPGVLRPDKEWIREEKLNKLGI